MNTARSLISPVLEYASSFNRFDYSSVYISLTPSCLPSYQAGELMSCRMPNRLKLFPGNEQEMQSQVLHNRIMSPFQSFWWGIWTMAKIIRPMPTVCPGINSLYTQWSVKLLFFFLGFVCFSVPVAFSKGKHVCSEINQGCCAVPPPYLWFISQMGPLLPLHSPSACFFFFFLPCNLSSPPPFLSPMSNFEFSLPSSIKFSSFASLSHLIFNSFSNLSSEHQKNQKTIDLVRFRAIHGRRAF